MCLFKFTYWDHHYEQSFNESGEVIYLPTDKGWYKFKKVIDVNEVRVKSFNSTVIFTEDGTPIECTEVSLTDDTECLAVNKIDTFEQNYKDNYLIYFQKPEETTE